MKSAGSKGIAAIPALTLALVVVPAAGESPGGDPQAKTKVDIPAPVLKAVRDNAPGAEIENVVVEENAGIRLYDIEFKSDRGEIEVAEDGTVIDVSVVVQMHDIPKPAADALRKLAEEAKASIRRLERAEVRAEIQVKDGKGTVVRLAAPRFVYEAELVRGRESGEVAVDPEGRIVEALKWEKSEQKKPGKPWGRAGRTRTRARGGLSAGVGAVPRTALQSAAMRRQRGACSRCALGIERSRRTGATVVCPEAFARLWIPFHSRRIDL